MYECSIISIKFSLQVSLGEYKENKVKLTFDNTKAEAISKEKIQRWCTQVGWEKLLNKERTTFRKLHPAVQMNATTKAVAIEIMYKRQSTIKCPSIEKKQNNYGWV